MKRRGKETRKKRMYRKQRILKARLKNHHFSTMRKTDLYLLKSGGYVPSPCQFSCGGGYCCFVVTASFGVVVHHLCLFLVRRSYARCYVLCYARCYHPRTGCPLPALLRTSFESNYRRRGVQQHTKVGLAHFLKLFFCLLWMRRRE